MLEGGDRDGPGLLVSAAKPSAEPCRKEELPWNKKNLLFFGNKEAGLLPPPPREQEQTFHKPQPYSSGSGEGEDLQGFAGAAGFVGAPQLSPRPSLCPSLAKQRARSQGSAVPNPSPLSPVQQGKVAEPLAAATVLGEGEGGTVLGAMATSGPLP